MHTSAPLPTFRLVRLVVLLFLPLALVAGFVLLMLPNRMNALALESARERAAGLTELTARLVAPALEFEAHEDAAQALARLAVEPELLSSVLYDEGGAAFASSPEAAAPGPGPSVPARTQIHVADAAIEVTAPVRAQGGTRGTLVVRLGLAGLEQRRADNMVAAGAAAAIVALVGLVFSFATSLFLVRRQTAEEAVRRAAQSYGDLADSLPVGLVIHREDCVVYVNPAGQELLSRGREIPAGTPLSEVLRPDRPLSGPSRTAEVEECSLTLADGREAAVAVAAVPMQLSGGAAVAMVVMDLTERKRLLERLVVTDRLASLGTMAAGVGHEINNPLAIVLANVELIREQLEQQLEGRPSEGMAEIMDELDDVRDAAGRVGRIVSDLRSLSRSENLIGPVDVEEAIEKALEMVGTQLGLRARVAKRFAGVPLVSGNEGRLVQVFINLLVNAVQALPERAVDHNLIEVTTSVGKGGDVIATVRDNGPGIPASICDRIFDPFFTTKPVGRGTGLGLSIVHNLVRTMGGRIELTSIPEGGTVFSIALPASLESAVLPGDEPVAELSPTRARLLVVDDEPMVCTVLKRLLGGSHEVVTTGDAGAALRQIAGGERFDLILCDLRMPGMSGLDLAERLSAKHPQQRSRLVFMTGDQGEGVSPDELGPILEKPFTRQDLVSFVTSQLEVVS